MKKLNVLSFVVGSARDKAADIDAFCAVFSVASLWSAFGAKTLPMGAFCAGWGIGRTFL